MTQGNSKKLSLISLFFLVAVSSIALVTRIWVVIASSMVLFALGSALGWIQLNPKPLIWANYLVGGGLFGTGMMLAGGCVVGNIMSGVALMSVGNLLFVVVVVLANWTTTYLYMMDFTFT